MQNYFRNITYLADRSGTSKWRRTWAYQLIDCHSQNTGIQVDYSQTPILDPRFYQGVKSITIQRWISDQHKEIVEKLLKPSMLRSRGWLIYEIDDLMKVEHIPLFNRGRSGFESPQVQENIRYMLNTADIVTVTTDYIKEAYHKYYGVPLEKIIAIPNMLPKYLFGDRYEPQKKTEQFNTFKKKPRIGIVSSLSHYNIQGVRKDKDGNAVRKQEIPGPNNTTTIKWINQKGVEIPEAETIKIDDDMDLIVECIKETVDDFQWVMFGYNPPQLKELIDAKKIETHGGVAIMNYPSMLENLKLQAIVAPIQDIEFNRCKSFIKYMECASIGVPLYASNCLPYSRIMPEKQLFNNSSDLKEKLLKLKFSSSGAYLKMIENQWNWLNTPCIEGDFKLNNFWMEDNLGIWFDLSRLKDKCNECSLQVYLDIKKQKEQENKANTIYSNENGVEIIK